MKFRTQRAHVAVVAWPAAITDPWLISVRTIPTTIAIRMVRRRLRGWAQIDSASKTAARRLAAGAWSGDLGPGSEVRVGGLVRIQGSLTVHMSR